MPKEAIAPRSRTAPFASASTLVIVPRSLQEDQVVRRQCRGECQHCVGVICRHHAQLELGAHATHAAWIVVRFVRPRTVSPIATGGM
jgi:hypothetical protein